jgi:hypothetical protein
MISLNSRAACHPDTARVSTPETVSSGDFVKLVRYKELLCGVIDAFSGVERCSIGSRVARRASTDAPGISRRASLDLATREDV